MSSLSQRIRKAALGPTPKPSTLRSDWIGYDDVWAVRVALAPMWADGRFTDATQTIKRFFLLFVAEAIDE